MYDYFIVAYMLRLRRTTWRCVCQGSQSCLVIDQLARRPSKHVAEVSRPLWLVSDTLWAVNPSKMKANHARQFQCRRCGTSLQNSRWSYSLDTARRADCNGRWYWPVVGHRCQRAFRSPTNQESSDSSAFRYNAYWQVQNINHESDISLGDQPFTTTRGRSTEV